MFCLVTEKDYETGKKNELKNKKTVNLNLISSLLYTLKAKTPSYYSPS